MVRPLAFGVDGQFSTGTSGWDHPFGWVRPGFPISLLCAPERSVHLGEQLLPARPALRKVLVEEEATRAGNEGEPGRILHAIPVRDASAVVDGDRIRDRVRQSAEE